VYEPLRNIMPAYNDILTMEMGAGAQSVNPSRLYKREGDTNDGWKLTPMMTASGTYAQIPADVKMVEIPTPQAVFQQLTIKTSLEAEMKRVLDDAVFGSADFSQQSGFHYEARQKNVNIMSGPWTRALATHNQRCMTESIMQAKEEKHGIRLSGKSVQGDNTGKTFIVDFDFGKDLPETWVLTCELGDLLPNNLSADINNFLQATNPNQPMYDFETMRANTGVRDPQAITRRVQRQQYEMSQANVMGMAVVEQQKKIALMEYEQSKMKKGSAEYFAKGLELHAAKAVYASLEAQITGGQPEQMPSESGFPPNVLPQEMTGESADLKAAATGVESSSRQGRPRPKGVK
jgi:hypothetical protein